MPIYTYKCNDCDRVFEARQRMSDDPLTECPHCVEGEVRRVINNVGIVFKGSGFYVTDSRNGRGTTVSSNGNGATEKAAEGKGSTSGDDSKLQKSTAEKSSTSS